MLNEFVIKHVCMAKAPFDFNLPTKHHVFSAMSVAATNMHIRFTYADYRLFIFFFDNQELYPDLFNNPDRIGVLRTVQIMAICKAMMETPFDHEVSDEVRIYSAMAQCTWYVKEYTTADVRLIQFLYNNRRDYPELFKKEELGC